MVFLRFHSKPGQPQTFAVVNTDGTGYREIAKLDASPIAGPTGPGIIAICCAPSLKDGTSRLLRISVADGQTRELLSLKAGKVTAAKFSPDGRFVAYQVQPASDADPVSQIFVLPAEGGEPQLVYEERLNGLACYPRSSSSIGPPTDAIWPLPVSAQGRARFTSCQ